MQTVISKYWTLDARPSKPTKYTPAQNIRLTNVALGVDLKDESTTSRTSLRVSTHGKRSVICSLTPTKIDQAVVDIIFVKGVQLTFEVIGHNDLSLSGYEFYDTVMQNMGRNDPQENDGEDQFGAAEGDASDKELKDLVVVDKVPGTGSLVMKKSVAHFYYLILNTDGAVVSRNDQGTSPATVHMENTKDTMPALTMGLLGMRVGGERQLLVPPHLGKGKRPVHGIKPDAPFYLYLKLVGVGSETGARATAVVDVD